MKAGRELDAVVAEKVMGWTSIRGAFDEDFWPVGTPPENQGKRLVAGVLEIQELVPNYSTDIAAAWEVVEKMGLLNERCLAFNERDEEWQVWSMTRRVGGSIAGIQAETAPLVICLVALDLKERE